MWQYFPMGETISCLSDDDATPGGVSSGGGINPYPADDIIDFTEDTKDLLNLSFDLTSCISDLDANGNGGYDFDRDEFIELSQEDIPIGVSALDIDQRLSQLGTKLKCFYQVPPNLDKPVGLRRYPHKNSPRTGDMIHPGEVVEVIQELEMDGVKYLKTLGSPLAGSGWLFQKHPILETVMLDYLPGELIEKQQSYMYKTDQTTPITILCGPNENCSKTNHVIFPGEEIDINEIWKPCDGEGKTYVKLCDGRGWVELNHPITNIEMFCELVP